MAKFDQANFEAAAISLAIDLTREFGHLHPDFLNVFAYPSIGNAAHECGGFALMDEQKPTVQGSLGGISFFQWTGMNVGKGGRRGIFMQLCKNTGRHPYSYGAALGMLISELKGSERNALPRTIAATVKANTPKPKDALMARVVAFELAYERAGVKHYPSRYTWAKRVKAAVEAWIAAGMPPRPGYVAPRGTFSADFDKAYGPAAAGPPLNRTRGQVLLMQKGAPIADEVDDIGNNPIELARRTPVELPIEADPYANLLPPVRQRRGFWAEQLLTVPEIKQVQTRLRDLGWVQVGTVDGRWDADFTIPTIKMLQAKAGIAEDGHYGPDTRRALGMGIRFEPPAARANVTATELKAVGEPTVQAAASIKSTSWWTGFGGLITVAGSALSEYAGDAWAIVRDVRSYVDNVPMWVLGLAVLAVAIFLWRKAQKVENIRVVEEQTGANTSLAIAHPGTVVEPPWQLPGVVAGGGYQPGAYGGEANPPGGPLGDRPTPPNGTGLPIRLASSPTIRPQPPEDWYGIEESAPYPRPSGGSAAQRLFVGPGNGGNA